MRRAPGPDLIFRAPRLGGGVQKTTGEVDTAQPTLTHQIMQRILYVDVEPVGEFVGEPALRRLGDPRLERAHERAVPREPHRLVGPQAVVVKARDLTQCIEPPPVGVAGQIAESLQFADDGEVGLRPQRLFERGQVSDPVTPKVRTQGLRVEGCWTHNVRVPTSMPPWSEL